jgi:outer membrane lipoprotein carrier protein
MRRLLPLFLLIFPVMFAPAAGAATIEELKSLLRETNTARSRFAQMVLDKNLKKLQESTGTMQFARPGKFRWEYEKPYQQTIVGDGTRVWVYDKDLNQVTVRKVDVMLGSSPAALLAGSNDIDKSYALTATGVQDGLDWIEAVPRTRDNTFEKVRLGFSKSGLEAMELRDRFGQVTVIKFSAIERNAKIAPETFKFTPPKGADVISDQK